MVHFEQLNEDWNADPNVPDPRLMVSGRYVILTFRLGRYTARQFSSSEVGRLSFGSSCKYRYGTENDEGWYRGQCRYSKIAPAWGEFHEVRGSDELRDRPTDWMILGPERSAARHFIFYLRDGMFECMANTWDFDAILMSDHIWQASKRLDI
jgi:hypothetical protein